MTHHDDSAWEPAYARRSERMKVSEIRELLKILEKPGIISFAGGIPDPQALSRSGRCEGVRRCPCNA
jgi:hypothetical protein